MLLVYLENTWTAVSLPSCTNPALRHWDSFHYLSLKFSSEISQERLGSCQGEKGEGDKHSELGQNSRAYSLAITY